MKIKRGRVGLVKTAPKSLEKRILDNAVRIKEDFTVILPTPLDEKAKKFVDKLRRKLEKVWHYRDDDKKLEKMSKKKGLESALAGTLMLANNPKAPYLAHTKIGDKDVAYALRGKAEKEMLISLQHFDDPVLRILGFVDLCNRKGLSLFSWNNKFLCSSEDNIPEDFLEFLSTCLGLQREGSLLKCHHIGSDRTIEHLLIKLKNLEIAICRDCLQNKNTVFEITKHAFIPNIQRVLSIEIKSELLEYGLGVEYKEEYLSGKLNDKEFFEKNLEAWKNRLKIDGRKIIYTDGRVYTDPETFLEELDAKENERKAIKILLAKVNEPIFLDSKNTNAILERYWKAYGEDILAELSGDRNLAKSIFNPSESPIKQIRELETVGKKLDKISRYPTYKNLPPVAKFIDDIAKNYIVHGKEKALSILSKPPKGIKERSI
ncbi:MAG TPA: hypothetical protein ENI14_03905, partial [Thermoplasmatales archaeon]|nr:hypothetical protein [Thermoplasmatales archaeon]